MTPHVALERRYRRLLAWFPAEHRTFYAEEMIGVLLASAPDDQSRPGGAETVDWVLGRAQAVGTTYSAAQVHAVLDAQMMYLEAIGAIGPEAPPGDSGPYAG